MDRAAILARDLFNQLDDADQRYILQAMEKLTHREQGRPVIDIEAYLRDRDDGEEVIQ